MTSKSLISVICLAALILALPALAKDKPRKGGPAHKSEYNADESRSTHEGREGAAMDEPRSGKHDVFSENEIGIIEGYVKQYRALPGKHERRLPPGLAKKVARGGTLPPGWQKKCIPGETLPPAVYQECRPLPQELVVKLPPPPGLTVTVALDGKIFRLLEATREILDVFDINVRL